MVGIKVGGTNSGLEVGSIIAAVVRVGTGVTVVVAVTVVLGDGTGDGVAVADCPHAMNDKPMTRKIMTRKRFFILTHFLETMLDGLLSYFIDKAGS